MRTDIIYFEQWKERECPIDREPCTVDKCAFFNVISRKLPFGEFADGMGQCTLPELTENEIRRLREIAGKSGKRSKIDLGNSAGEVSGNSEAAGS